jgi:hypothetical protein
LKGYRSAIGLRMIVQFVALALLPIGALAALLAAQSALTPQFGRTLCWPSPRLAACSVALTWRRCKAR